MELTVRFTDVLSAGCVNDRPPCFYCSPKQLLIWPFRFSYIHLKGDGEVRGIQWVSRLSATKSYTLDLQRVLPKISMNAAL